MFTTLYTYLSTIISRWSSSTTTTTDIFLTIVIILVLLQWWWSHQRYQTPDQLGGSTSNTTKQTKCTGLSTATCEGSLWGSRIALVIIKAWSFVESILLGTWDVVTFIQDVKKQCLLHPCHLPLGILLTLPECNL